MKLIHNFSMIICLAAIVGLSACEMKEPPFGPTDRPDQPVVPTPVEPLTDTIGWNVPAEAITVAQAREICAGLASQETTGTKYYVMGFVKKLHDKHASGITDFGNAQFYIEDVKGKNSAQDFMAYQVYGPDGAKLTDPACVVAGDFVVIYGELTNYNNTYETVGKGAAYIWKSTNPYFAPKPTQVTVWENTLETSTDFDAFTAYSAAGDAHTWKYVGGKTGRFAQMNGADQANEDWLITPLLPLADKSDAVVTFKQRFSAELTTEEQAQYTLWASADYDGNTANFKAATWVELTGMNYNATTFTSAGEIALPAALAGKDCYIAWKYNGGNKAWSIRNVKVTAMAIVQ